MNGEPCTLVADANVVASETRVQSGVFQRHVFKHEIVRARIVGRRLQTFQCSRAKR